MRGGCSMLFFNICVLEGGSLQKELEGKEEDWRSFSPLNRDHGTLLPSCVMFSLRWRTWITTQRERDILGG